MSEHHVDILSPVLVEYKRIIFNNSINVHSNEITVLKFPNKLYCTTIRIGIDIEIGCDNDVTNGAWPTENVTTKLPRTLRTTACTLVTVQIYYYS